MQKILILITLELSLVLLASFGFISAIREKDDKVFRILFAACCISCLVVGAITVIGFLGS